jgi:hypothetical protein
MDADTASLVRRSIGAALLGQRWIDEEFDGDEWERKYYTAIRILRDRDPNAWQTYQAVANRTGENPDSRRPAGKKYVRFARKFRAILAEVGIDLEDLG